MMAVGCWSRLFLLGFVGVKYITRLGDGFQDFF